MSEAEGLLHGPWLLRWIINLVLILISLSLFLAVAAIRLRARNERQEARWRDLEARWTPQVLDVVNGETDGMALSRSVRVGDARAFMDFLYRFARRLRGPEWRAVQKVAAPHVPTLIRQLEGADPERRARIVQIVGEFGLPEHVDVLVGALDDVSPLVAMVAARRLFRPGNEAHFEAVLRQMDRFEPWNPRLLAGMLRAGGAKAIPLLRGVYEDPAREPGERAVAANALKMFPDPGAADAATRVLSEDEAATNLKAASLRLLQVVGHGGHRAVVVAHLESSDSVVRQAAAEALGSVGSADDADRLARLIRDDSPWVSLSAAKSLQSLAGRERLEAEMRRGGGELPALRQILDQG